MALVLKDRVRETSTTTGTGSFTLGGTSTGFQSFSVIGDGNTTYYGIVNSVAGEWEVGIGTYTASGAVLSRDTILESSNGGSAVNFSAGTKDVFVTYPAEKSASTDTFASPPAIGSTTPAAGTFTTLTATGQTSLGGVAGADTVRVTSGTNTGKYTLLSSDSVSNTQLVGGAGGTGFVAYASGTNSIRFRTNGAAGYDQMLVTNTAFAVNYVQVTGAATGAPSQPIISAQGSDANINIALQGKGTGSAVLLDSGGGSTLRAIPRATGGDTFLDVRRDIGGVSLLASSSVTNGSVNLISKGTGAIDLAAGSSGVNISNGGTVTAITRTATGSGYTAFPSVAITAPTTAGGVQATASVAQMVSNTATIQAGGTGYTLNDIVTLVGGTPATVASTYTVTAVSGGVVTAVTPLNFTAYTALPTNPVSVTGGTGSGLTLNVTYAIQSSFTITNAGSGYVEQPTVTFSGGGGSGAAAYATVGAATQIKTLFGSSTSGLSIYTPVGEQVRFVNVGDGTRPLLINGGGAGGSAVAGLYQPTSTATLGFSTNTGPASFYTGGQQATEQFRVAHTASAVNYVQVTGAATGGSVVLSSQGSDANVPLNLQAKGSSYINAIGWMRVGTASANYIQLQAAGAGSAPVYTVAGSDTNIDLSLTTKGTGSVNLNSGTGVQMKVSESVSAADAPLRVFGGKTAVAPPTISGDLGLRIQTSNDSAIRFATDGGTAGAFGTEQMRIARTASAVNYVQVTGAATGNSPFISAQGSDSNIAFGIYAKGNATTFMVSNNAATFEAYGPASAVNRLRAQSAIAGGAPTLYSIGADTNIDLALTPKGTGTVVANGPLTATGQTSLGGAAGSESFRVYAPSGVTRYLNATGTAAGDANLFADGPVGSTPAVAIYSRSTGLVKLGTAYTSGTSTGTVQFQVSHTASAVNYVQVTGAATVNDPVISVQGSDANLRMILRSKGTLGTRLTSSDGSVQFATTSPTGTANYLQAAPSAAGSAPVLSVQGSDTNIDLTLTPKGTGNVVIGSSGLLVGTTTTSLVTGISAAKLSISGSGDGLTVLSGSGNDTINVAKSGTPSGTWVGFFAADGTGYGNITVNGAGTAYNTTSDYRLKNIDGPLTGAKDFILALKPKQGTWKADGSKFVGFVADEFQQVSPTSVTGEKDAVDADGKPIYQTMQASSSEVMANLIALVQEQQAVIEQLKADVAKLKAV